MLRRGDRGGGAGGGYRRSGVIRPRCLLLLLLLVTGCADTALPYATARAPRHVQQVSVPLPEGPPLRAVLALPDGPATGATIIALHGCGGLARPERTLRLPLRESDWAARLTEAGHPVLFPDSFGSRGLGEACGVRGFPAGPLVRRGDVHAAAAWAAAQPWARPGGAVLLGWSHGGSTALTGIAEPLPPGLIQAAIAYYPGCFEIGRAAPWRPAAPVLMLLGGADNWTPAAECRALAARSPDRLEQVTYPGAHHGFDAPGGTIRNRTLPNGRMVTVGSDSAARDASMQRVVAYLAARAGAQR